MYLLTSHDPLMSGFQVKKSMDDLFMSNLFNLRAEIDKVDTQRPNIRTDSLLETKPIVETSMDVYVHEDLDARKSQELKVDPPDDNVITMEVADAN